MDSLNTMLNKIEVTLAADADLKSYAGVHAANFRGSASTFTLNMGEDVFSTETPFSKFPFIHLVIGDETDRKITAAGKQITRQFLFQFGIVDKDQSRCTERITTLEELIVSILNQLFGGEVNGPDNPTGLLIDHEMGKVITDSDSVRPMSLRQLTVELTYVIN